MGKVPEGVISNKHDKYDNDEGVIRNKHDKYDNDDY